ncbi:mechanosensitive ion channel family protein [Patescibacteria group bacterium]
MEDQTFVSSLVDWLSSSGVRILIIIVGAFIVDKVIDGIVDRAIVKYVKSRQKDRDQEEITQRAKTLSDVFNTTSSVVLAIVAIMMILPELGIQIGPLLAGAGIVGLAVGFGAQNLVRDFFSGVFIVMENQFAKGDIIKINNTTAGSVEDFTLRRTVLRDLDGVQHHIPNGEITAVANLSQDWSRMNLDISVSYDTDLEKAIKVITETGDTMYQDKEFRERMLEAPQVLGVNKFADSSIDIKVICKTRPGKVWEVTREFRLRIKQAFDKAGIEIPFPQVDVHQKR